MAWRLECDYGEETDFTDLWQQFLDSVDTTRVRALLIGPWWREDYTPFAPVRDLLVAHADRFPALRGLFLADVVGEECEVSWLRMCDITAVLEAFPLLEEFTVRGCGQEGLALRPIRHTALKTLRFESGGLPGDLVRAVAASELPALERLDLWFGSSWYGADATVEDIGPVLSGGAFPACATWACRTASSRTRSRRPWPRRPSSPSWRPSPCPWAPSATRAGRPC